MNTKKIYDPCRNKISRIVLVDNLGRIIGKLSNRLRLGSCVEYGHRNSDGILFVVGIAYVKRKSIVEYDYDNLEEYEA